VEPQPFIIPEITFEKHLNDELLAVSGSIKAELIRSIQLHSTNIVESTHLTRKRLKLYRAFIKLFKKCGDEDSLKQLNTTFRRWGETFSELRDAHVHRMFITSTIVGDLKSIDPGVIQKIQEEANHQIEQLENRLVVQGDVFKNLEVQVQNHSSADTFIRTHKFETAHILEGFKLAFRKSHRAFKLAESSRLSEPFHEWRKRLKDVQYQLDLLRSHQNEINFSASDVEHICEKLGKGQDLNNFIQWVGTLKLEPESVNRLLHHLKKSQIKLKKQLIIEGNRFYKHSSI